MERLLVILDIDETLVYASETGLDTQADFRTAHYHVYKRPGLDAFIADVTAEYRTAVWTSASAAYAAEIVPRIFPNEDSLEFVWARDKCTMRYDLEFFEYYHAKQLKKITRSGYSLERTIVIDDTPKKHESNYGNLVSVVPYYGGPDDELPLLTKYLERLATEPNVRRVEKRGWRHQVVR